MAKLRAKRRVVKGRYGYNNNNNTVQKIGNVPNTFSLEFVEKYINKICKHTTFRPGADTCTPLGNMLLLGLISGKTINKSVINKYLSSISRSSYRNCLYSNLANLVDILNGIMGYINFMPSDSFLKKLVKNDQYYSCLSVLANQNKHFTNFSIKFVEYVLNTICLPCTFLETDDNNLDCSNEDEEKVCSHKNLLDTILGHCDIEKVLHLMLICRCPIVHEKCKQLIKEKPEIFTNEHLYSCCKLFSINKDIFEMLVNIGLKVDQTCLQVVCSSGDIEAIHHILCYKIPVNKASFNSLFNSRIQKTLIPRYGRHRLPKISYTKGYSKDKVEMLINFGYKPDRDDLINSIKAKVELPDIDRFGLYLDDELMELCYKLKFFPNYEYKGNRELMELQKLCRTCGLTVIKKYIQDNNIKPDKVCLKNAILSSNAEKSKIMYYLIVKHDIDFDFNDLQQYISITGRFTTYKHGPYNRRTRSRVKLDKSGIDWLTYFVQLLHKRYSPDDCYNDLIDDEDVDQDADQEETKNDTVIKIIRLKNKGIVIPKQKNRKLLAPKKYCEYFKTDVKTKKAYSDIKNELVELINNKNWIAKNNNDYIDLPKDLRKKLSLGDGYIHKKNIDKLVNQFYNKTT